jgi:IclR family transcriptional regulator, acetate operon repressor
VRGEDRNPYTIRAAERVVDILDLLHRAPEGVTLAEVAASTAMPKSSAFRYLSTLEARGFVERDGSVGNYHLGVTLVPPRTPQLERLAAQARPVLAHLRDKLGETVNLGILDGARVAYLAIVESRRGMRFAARAGDREPMHSTALGKAIASLLDEERVRAILAAEGMPQRTARTITDPDLFIKEMDEVRRTGFAIDRRENEEDGCCVAVPVAGIRVAAAISLSAPAVRLSEEQAERAAPALRRAALRLSRAVGSEA